MDHDGHTHMGGGGDMAGMAAPPPSMVSGTAATPHHTMASTMMHMSFFWGSNAEILFSGWPGTRPAMYALALVLVFTLAAVVEWLSHARLIKPETSAAAAGIIQTAMHTMRVALAYMVMLAVMSFNVGVLLAAVAGHSVGFFLFGRKFFGRTDTAVSAYDRRKHPDLPPMSC